MPNCTECGEFVSYPYARVAGDNQDNAICPTCRKLGVALPNQLGGIAGTYRGGPP